MADPIARQGAIPTTPPLVGRDRELAVLRAALDAALAGRGSLVLIGGEAGIGKTALAQALCREAEEQGCVVLTGRCFDLAETPPYGPWIDLFAHLPADRRLPPLPEAFATRGTVGAVASQAALLRQILAFLRATAARQPTVLLLDDLHWADAASLDALRAVAREAATLRLLLLVAYRSEELTRRHPLYTLLPVLERESRATRLDLRRFAADDVRALLDRRYDLPDADAARLGAWLHGRADGNAFFTAQLLRAIEDAGVLHRDGGGWALGDLGAVGLPAALRQVLDGRLARLGDEAQRHLTLAAVIGAEVPLALWATVADTGEDGLLDTIERAVEARLLTEAPDGSAVRFGHALIREALYEGLLATRRRRVHRLVAEVLAATAGPDPDGVAYHFRQASDPRAAAWLVSAGERAQRAYAWISAAERYEAALALLEGDAAARRARVVLLMRLAQLRRYANPQAGVPPLEEATRLADEAGDRALAAASAFDQGQLRCLAGEYRLGLDQMLTALPTLEALSPAERAELPSLAILGITPAEATRYHREALMRQLVLAGRFADVRALSEGGEHTSASTARGLATLGWLHLALGQPAAARRAFAMAADVFQAAGQYLEVAGARTQEQYFVVLRYQADDLTERRQLDAAIERGVQRAAGVNTRVSGMGGRLASLFVEGAWEELHRLTLALGSTQNSVFEWSLGPMARAQGDDELAWVHVRRILPAGPSTAPGGGNYFLQQPYQQLAALLAVDAGDLPSARAWLEAHDHWLAWSGAVLGRAEGQLGWAAYHRAAGDNPAAREHAERALAHATEPRQPLALLAAHRFLGELATVEGRHADAQAQLDRALALAAACAAPYERALTFLALAELRLATGDRAGAQLALTEARALLEPLGARPALARAAALANRLTANAPTSSTTPPAALPAGLSAREVEVLRLVAAGLTNAQAAERLYLSPRTVDQHLRSTYSKLGVSSRAAASRWAAERGLTGEAS